MKNLSRKLLLLALAAALLITSCLTVALAEGALNDAPVKTVALDASDPNYDKELWAAELYNYKMIRNFTTMYEQAGWNAYRDACVNLDRMNPEALTDAEKAVILNAKKLREALVQVIPYAEEALFIWGDKMPVLTENVETQFTAESQDNVDFRPFLIP